MGGNRRNQDHFGKRAKREHFPARSVYKLAEIDKRVRLFKTGMNILDLGAAPGSWSLYAATRVTPGTVVAVDRARITIGLPGNVVTIEQNCFDIVPDHIVTRINKNGFDAVISDMAPKTSGHRFVDQTRSYHLFCQALSLAAQCCRPGGSFVGKIFTGEDFETARDHVRKQFTRHKIIRPKSVRSESYETYIVGLEKRSDTPCNID